jgi:hypothetical protein
MKNNIFRYDLKNAWGQLIKSLYVDKDNKLHLVGELNQEENVSVIKTDKINKILQKYEDQFIKVIKEEVPFVPVMDGYINEISININGKIYNDRINNLGYYDDEAIDNSKHLSLIFKLLDELYDELYSQNKEIKKYFVVTEDEEEEEE